MKATCSKCGTVRNSFEEMLLHNSGCKGPNIVRQMNVTVSRLPESVMDELEQHLMEVDDEHGLDSQQVAAFQQLVVGYGAAWDAVELKESEYQSAIDKVNAATKLAREYQTQIQEIHGAVAKLTEWTNSEILITEGQRDNATNSYHKQLFIGALNVLQKYKARLAQIDAWMRGVNTDERQPTSNG